MIAPRILSAVAVGLSFALAHPGMADSGSGPSPEPGGKDAPATAPAVPSPGGPGSAMGGGESGQRPPVKRPEEAVSVYRRVPDIPIRLADGRETSLSDLWTDRPLLMTLVFSRCAGVCSPFLRTLRSLADADGGGGREYDLLALSFDARDSTAAMAAMAEAIGAAGRPGWHFAVASPESIERLTTFLDFQVQWNESTAQFDHPATLVAIDDGRVVRVVTGGALSPARFREVTAELRGDFVAIYPTAAGVRFRCFEFRADGNLRPSWGMLLLVYPSVAALLLVGTVFLLVRRPSPPWRPAAKTQSCA